MSEHARNLDTYGDGDTGPEWFPEVGERVEVRHSAIAYTGAKSTLSYFGTVTSIEHGEEEPEYHVRMESNPFGRDNPWYVIAVADDLEPA